jgi:hypothetical protein
MAKIKKQNLLLIQPHSDDIIFSAANFLKDRHKYNEVIMLTVEHNEKRFEEDRLLCETFDMTLMTLRTKVSSENFHKEYYSDKKLLSDDSAMSFCLMKIGENKMLKLASELDGILETLSGDGYLIVTCLGVGHPFHWLVRMFTERHSDLFYRDFPHSYKKRNKEYFVGLTNSDFKLKESHEIVGLIDEDGANKFQFVKDFYKSQSSLLFFEQGYIKKMLPEEYYEKTKN